MGAWLLFEPYLTHALWPESAATQRARYTLVQDENSNLYYIEDVGGVNTLTVLDASGNLLLSQEMPVITDASTYHVDGLYVASTKNMFVAVSEMDRESETVSGLSLHLFFESGAYAKELLSVPCTQAGLSYGGAFFAAMSETQTHVNIGVCQDGRLRTYRQEKGNSEALPQPVRDIALTSPIYKAAVLSNHDVVTAPAGGGIAVYAANQSAPQTMGEKTVIAGAIFPGEGQEAYLHDTASGSLYRLNTDDGALEVYCGGGQPVDYEADYLFADFRMVHMTPTGRIAGIARSGEGDQALFLGTRQLMSRLALPEDAASVSLLGVAAIALGVLLISILLWDAYCRLLKMRLYIMVRQTLLVVAGVASMVYLLITLLIEPNLNGILSEQYYSRLTAAGESLSKAVENLEPHEDPQELLLAMSSTHYQTAPIHFDLIDAQTLTLIASSDGYVPGTAASLLPYRPDLTDMIRTATEEGTCYAQQHEAHGNRAYALLKLSDGRVIVTSAGTQGIARGIESLTKDITDFVSLAGIALAVLLLLIESITVYSIRRLKKGMDAASAGDYGVSIKISSGDEVETLANSFNTMTKLVRSGMENLNRLNRSYFRFVPEDMIRLLGANSPAELDLGSCAKKRMTMMVVRFRFEKGAPQDTDELFENINRVIQALSPAVPENGGTVYDLHPDGFNAMFQGGCEDGVRAALRVRANAEQLNASASGKARKVDVRIVLTVGEVMLGVVGDEVRLFPTAISDAIEAANSIMDIAEPSNLYICCTQNVIEEVRDYRCRYIGLYETPYGMQRLYDLFDGDPFESAKHKQMCLERFNNAVSAFYRSDFASAKNLFMEVIKLSVHDRTSVNYMYYADQYMRQPPTTLSYHVLKDGRLH